MTTEADVTTALREAEAMPIGQARVQAHERAVRLADDLGRKDHQVKARLALGEASYYTPPGAHDLPTFVWLLNALDGEPIDDQARARILWMSKWAMTRILETPQIPLDVVRATYEDIERRMRAEGFTDRAYAQHRARLARYADSAEVAREWLARWQGAARDQNADCHACEASSLASMLSWLGDDEGALAALRPVLAAELTCHDQPKGALGISLASFVAVDAADEAARAHLRGWRLCKDSQRDADVVANHLVFLARSGHSARALRLLQPRLPWVEQVPSEWMRLHFAAAVACVLEAAQRDGVAPAEVGGASVAALVARLRDTAGQIATAFDERNGTTVLSEGVAAWSSPEPYAAVADLSAIGEVPARLGEAAAGASTTTPVTPTAAGTSTTSPGAPTPGAAGQPGPAASAGAVASATSLRDALQAAVDAMDFAGAQSATEAWATQRERLMTGDDVDWAAVSHLDRQLGRPQGQGPAPLGDDDLLQSAVQAARRAGDEVLAIRARGILHEQEALRATTPEEHSAAREALSRTAGELLALGAHTEAGAVHLSLMRLQTSAEGAAAAAAKAAELYSAGGNERWATYATIIRARAIASADPEGAAALLTTALEDARRLGPGDLWGSAVSALAELQVHRGDHDAALATIREAVAESDSTGADAWPLLETLGDLLVEHDAWEELLAEAPRLVEAAAAGKDPVRAALARRFLGLALHETGRHLEGAEALEAALPALREAEHPSLAPCLWALGGALAALGEPAQAAPTFREAATAFTRSGRSHEASHAHLRAAGAFDESGDSTQALAHADVAATLAEENAALDVYVAARRTRAAALATAPAPEGGVESAIAALRDLPAEAARLAARDDVEAEINLEYLQATLSRQGMYLLADREDYGRAAEWAETARRQFADLEPHAALVLQLQRGDLLVRAGDPRTAEPVLREVIPLLRAAGDDDNRIEAAASLAQALHDLGRPEEADVVWQEHGPIDA